MKRLLLTSIIFASSLLVACGGGGSPPIPQATPTPVPATYTVSYNWTGAMHGPNRSASSVARHAMSGTSTPEPVQMAQNDGTYGAAGSTNVYAVVSPSPSASAVPTWAPIPSDAPVQPGPQGTPGVLTLVAKNQSGVTTLNGTVPIPGAPQTVTPLVYVFASVPLACTPATAQDPNSVQGVAFSGATAVAVSDPSTADLYVDGPTCAGAFANSSESATTLHVPGGFALFSLNNESFADVATAQWTSAFTSLDWPTLQSKIRDATTATSLGEMQTRSAHYSRFYFGIVGSDGTATITYDVSGHSLTGTY